MACRVPRRHLPRLVMAKGRVLGLPVPTISVLLLYAVCYVVLTRTRLGRYTYAIGSNPQATLLSGVNIPRYLMVVYMISGVTAALAGLTEMSRIGSGQPAGARDTSWIRSRPWSWAGRALPAWRVSSREQARRSPRRARSDP
jgi:predicted ABC-type sugar transport system permease subunit